MGTAWPTWQPRHQQEPSHGCERLTAPLSACSPGRPGTLRQLKHRISARHRLPSLLQESPQWPILPMHQSSGPGYGLCRLFRCLTLLLVSLPVEYPLPSEVTLWSPSSQPTILVSALGNGLNPSIPHICHKREWFQTGSSPHCPNPQIAQAIDYTNLVSHVWPLTQVVLSLVSASGPNTS